MALRFPQVQVEEPGTEQHDTGNKSMKKMRGEQRDGERTAEKVLHTATGRSHRQHHCESLLGATTVIPRQARGCHVCIYRSVIGSHATNLEAVTGLTLGTTEGKKARGRKLGIRRMVGTYEEEKLAGSAVTHAEGVDSI